MAFTPYIPVGWSGATNDNPPALSGQNLKHVEDGLVTLSTEFTNAFENGEWKPGAVNTWDLGAYFAVAPQYNKLIIDALPATGGLYNPTAYSELFNMIKYNHGSGLSITNKNLPVGGGTAYASYFDTVNGDIYVISTAASSIIINAFDKNLICLRLV